jgi:putative phosphoesterase
MRLAALYDIHGNLPALEAVLDEVSRASIDRIVVGGDVLPGPLPVETLARLSALDIPADFIHGNGDREVLAIRSGIQTESVPEAFREAVRWNADQLQPEHERWLRTWPGTMRLEIPGLGNVLFCHATPQNDVDIFTRLTPEAELLAVFDGLGVDLVVCGHTHMPFDRVVGRTRVVNAGSVGMPFGKPGACWLVLGPGVEPRQTAYDLGSAAERVRASSYPQAEAFAATSILQPPSEETILAMFESKRRS